MKKIFLILMICSSIQAFPQSNKAFKLNGVEEIEIGILANVEIDCSLAESMDVQASKETLEQLEIYQEGNRLFVRSKGEIKPEEDVQIAIGAPQLRFVQGNARSSLIVKEVKREEFSAMALSGEIKLFGKSTTLRASGEKGKVDASEFEAKEVKLNLWDAATAILGSPEKVSGKTRKTAKISYKNNPEVNVKTYAESNFKQKESQEKKTKIRNPEARFINFTLRNNSVNRIQCYVKGPKPDGSSFSYGFPMNPGQKRKKDWSIGSKVYRVNKMGMRKLLIEIKAEDEGQVVKMYPGG